MQPNTIPDSAARSWSKLGTIENYPALALIAATNHFAFLLHCGCSADRTFDFVFDFDCSRRSRRSL